MLKGIDPVLSPELLMYLSAMGHGEWVAVVDANFTAEYLRNGKPLVRLPGLGLARVTQAVLSVFPLAEDVAQPAAYMQVSGSAPHHRTAAQQAVVVSLANSTGSGVMRCTVCNRSIVSQSAMANEACAPIRSPQACKDSGALKPIPTTRCQFSPMRCCMYAKPSAILGITSAGEGYG